MNCCSACFGDRGLSEQIIPQLSSNSGKCNYCGTKNISLITPIELRDHFEVLISAYFQDKKGKKIVEWLQEDWFLFPRMDVSNAMRLLGDILDDGDIVRKNFLPKLSEEKKTLNVWSTLRTELMYENRFFPETDLDLERLKELLSFIIIKSEKISTNWYRARIQETNELFSLDEMGAPPKRKASHGRANPAGIPYLYVASDYETAISEIRPHTGELVNVAEFSLGTELSFIDLRNPRELVSPFLLEDGNEVALLRGNIGFLEHLGNELMRPILPSGAAIDYIPTQYLCEFIKKCGYDGVIYKSSVGKGMNLALFNPENTKPGEKVTQHRVSKVSIKIEKN